MRRAISVAGEAVPVYSDTGAVVGEIVSRTDGRWLEKRNLDPKTHQLRKPPAWCTDRRHIAMLRGISARGVRIHATDGSTWTAKLADFEKYGLVVRRGHGEQVALPLSRWTVTRGHRDAGRQLVLAMDGTQ